MGTTGPIGLRDHRGSSVAHAAIEAAQAKASEFSDVAKTAHSCVFLGRPGMPSHIVIGFLSRPMYAQKSVCATS